MTLNTSHHLEKKLTELDHHIGYLFKQKQNTSLPFNEQLAYEVRYLSLCKRRNSMIRKYQEGVRN